MPRSLAYCILLLEIFRRWTTEGLKRFFASIALWQRRRRIRKLESGLTLGRRHFIQGLLLAPFTPIPKDPVKLREVLVSEYLMTPEGRHRLAMSMIQPLRRRLDYTSIGRKLFQVEQLPTGALPIYDKDPEDPDSES